MSKSRSSIKGAMFSGLVEIECIPASDKKPRLIAKFLNLPFSEQEKINAMDELMIRMGLNVKNNKVKRYQNETHSIREIEGEKKVEEAIKSLMQIAEKEIIIKKQIAINGKTQTLYIKPLQSYEDTNFAKNLEAFRKNLSQVNRKKQKTQGKIISEDGSIVISKITPKSNSNVPTSAHEVYEADIERKDKKTEPYFIKENVGPIIQIEAFGSEVNRLVLGKDRVSESLVIYDEDGMRRGIASRKIEGFTSLSSEFKKIGNIANFSEKLIDRGIGKIETANFIFGNVDGHLHNAGFSDNGDGPLCSIDFDQIFWEITCIYAGFLPDVNMQVRNKQGRNKLLPSPKQILEIKEKDILQLPNVDHSVKGLKQQYLEELRVSEDVLNKMAADPRFIKDKWYTFLRYLLIGETAYGKLLKTFFTSEKHKKEILDYVIQRRNKFKMALQNIEEFKLFISQTDNLEMIKKDFAKDYTENELKELGLDSKTIDLEFANIFTPTILKEKQLEPTLLPVEKTYHEKINQLITLLDSADARGIMGRIKQIYNSVYRFYLQKSNGQEEVSPEQLEIILKKLGSITDFTKFDISTYEGFKDIIKEVDKKLMEKCPTIVTPPGTTALGLKISSEQEGKRKELTAKITNKTTNANTTTKTALTTTTTTTEPEPTTTTITPAPATTTTTPEPEPATITTTPKPEPATITTTPKPEPATTTTTPEPEPATITTTPEPESATITTTPKPEPESATITTTPEPESAPATTPVPEPAAPTTTTTTPAPAPQISIDQNNKDNGKEKEKIAKNKGSKNKRKLQKDTKNTKPDENSSYNLVHGKYWFKITLTEYIARNELLTYKLRHSRKETAKRLLNILNENDNNNIDKNDLIRILILEYDALKKGSGAEGKIARAIKDFLDANGFKEEKLKFFDPHLLFPTEQMAHYSALRLLDYVQEYETSLLYKISPTKDAYENEFKKAGDYAHELMKCDTEEKLETIKDNILKDESIKKFPTELKNIFDDIWRAITNRKTFDEAENEYKISNELYTDPKKLFDKCFEQLYNSGHTIIDELLDKLLKISEDKTIIDPEIDPAAKCKEMVYLIEITKRKIKHLSQPLFGLSIFDSNCFYSDDKLKLKKMLTLLDDLQIKIRDDEKPSNSVTSSSSTSLSSSTSVSSSLGACSSVLNSSEPGSVGAVVPSSVVPDSAGSISICSFMFNK